jgi:O-methyltransferase
VIERDPSFDDCEWYHSIDLPEIGRVEGIVDLTPDPDEYIGRIELKGRRVLEVGPANGFLSFHMERSGAEVVAVELPEDHPWDFVPLASLDIAKIRPEREDTMRRLRNAFWFAHRRLDSRVRVHYGDARTIPDSLGRFDVSLLGAILEHTRDPLGILDECARLTDRTIVIVEVLEPTLGDLPIAKIVPTDTNQSWHTWWTFSPGFFTSYLPALGFSDLTVTTCTRRNGSEDQTFFTVVAHRTEGSEP